MERLAKVLGAITGLMLVGACAVPAAYNSDDNYNDDSYLSDRYGSDADYETSCDYYEPPWGYPSDHCRYQLWSEPVYYAGTWYGGPIYYRSYGGENWFWLNGGWRRDEWRGPRPRIDWDRGGNVLWHGDIRRGRDGFARHGGFVRRNIDDDFSGSDERGVDNRDRGSVAPANDGVSRRFGRPDPEDIRDQNNVGGPNDRRGKGRRDSTSSDDRGGGRSDSRALENVGDGSNAASHQFSRDRENDSADREPAPPRGPPAGGHAHESVGGGGNAGSTEFGGGTGNNGTINKSAPPSDQAGGRFRGRGPYNAVERNNAASADRNPNNAAGTDSALPTQRASGRLGVHGPESARRAQGIALPDAGRASGGTGAKNNAVPANQRGGGSTEGHNSNARGENSARRNASDGAGKAETAQGAMRSSTTADGNQVAPPDEEASPGIRKRRVSSSDSAK